MGTSTKQSPGPTKSIGGIKGPGKTDGHDSDPTKTSGQDGNRGSDTTSSGNKDTSTQGIPIPFVVEPPPPGTEPKQKKQRPSGMTYKKGNADPIKGKPGAAAAETVIMVQALIQGMFAVGASRLGPHWAITDDEAIGIAGPAANILAKYMDTDKFRKYSDPGALVIALGVVMAPRVMISVTTKKKKEVKVNAPIEPQPSKPDARSSRTDGGENIGAVIGYSGDPAKADVNQLLNLANTSPY